jgi:hypothetical protein
MDAINDNINDKSMDAINGNIMTTLLHICHILQYIITMHSFAQYQIIFLHYCDNIYFFIPVCNDGDME